MSVCCKKNLRNRVRILEAWRGKWEHVPHACGNAEEINTGH